MQKKLALLFIIPVLFLTVFPSVLRSSTLSNFTKGATAGLFIGLIIISLLVYLLQNKGKDMKQTRLGRLKNRLLHTK
ncbi:hypothetical protein H1230_09435 [Paenibacillus sp. 19GGS1-52]|uniref:hypothetical protein n=1 Tax=Paenibacillus sp. 19GGS1-52 TaxID=2758563 RepID=UPI001EFB13EE|nr:hypothetical protein [Paenibacillus sp. 19GGS1-52]ULO08966.1 hypothetical protein H1230_09435 [Paenibacillus sp. 19GGS1-52]